MQEEKEWFKNWFNTPFYHVLYDYRNDEEAEFFMKNLVGFLQLKKGDRILDLPCGKGRHALFLNAEGFKTTGADISENSIQYAKRFENADLKFTIHDMRDPLTHQYNAIFNLFTSFGYFNEESTNIRILKNFKNALLPGGHIAVDFLNLKKVIKDLEPYQQFTKKGIEFTIRKKVSEEFITKEIEVNFENKSRKYIEKVQALDLNKMEKFTQLAGLKIKHVFGDYALKKYDEHHSERLIMIIQ